MMTKNALIVIIGFVLMMIVLNNFIRIDLDNSPATLRDELSPEIIGTTGSFNLGQYDKDEDGTLSIAELKGKVVLLEFWTYSCINCRRVVPYLNEWYSTYNDDGLVVVGIHTPEFGFEKDIANVRKQSDSMGIEFPVLLDNNYETWRSFENNYWPHRYIIDREGKLRYDHIGEGAYKQSEDVIKMLLGQNSTKPSQ
jgi:thiol-disulfide isomerase/thioredoxin